MLGDSAKEELKRVDHLVYVTLKYTRTCDVIKSIIKRMISAYDEIIKEGLEKKRVKKLPVSRIEMAELFYKKLNKKGIKGYFDLYFLLRKIEVAKYLPREEYRKHVTMIAKIDDKDVEIDIPKLYEFQNRTEEFVNLVIDTLK